MSEPHPNPVLDSDVIQELKDLDDGGTGLLEELAELFLTDTPQRLERLHTALEAGDSRCIEEVAHSLKSSCANIGALSLSTLFRELETLARGGEIDGAADIVARSLAEFDKAREALQAQLG